MHESSFIQISLGWKNELEAHVGHRSPWHISSSRAGNSFCSVDSSCEDDTHVCMPLYLRKSDLNIFCTSIRLML